MLRLPPPPSPPNLFAVVAAAVAWFAAPVLPALLWNCKCRNAPRCSKPPRFPMPALRPIPAIPMNPAIPRIPPNAQPVAVRAAPLPQWSTRIARMIVLVVRAALSVSMISMTMTPHVPAAVRLWTITITTRTARFAAALAVHLWIWMMMTRTARFAAALAVQLRIRTRTPRMSACSMRSNPCPLATRPCAAASR